MPRIAYLASLLIPIVCLFACGYGDVESGAPARIDFGEAVFDAGRVLQGAKIDHVFAFRNSGERELRISRLRVSCDCIAVADTEAAVPAGDAGEIATSFDTTGLFGAVTRTIVVFSNDPTSPAVQLKLRANVAADVAATPRRFHVGRVQRGDDVSMQARIVLDGATEVAGIDYAGAVIEARLVEPAAGSVPGNVRRFQIHIQEQAPPGPFTEVVTVRTTSRATPALTIPVSGVVEGKS